MLELIYLSNKTISGGSTNGWSMCYRKGEDALLFHNSNSGYNRAEKLYRDGTSVPKIPVISWLYLLTRVGGRHCWMNSYAGTNGQIWAAEEITGLLTSQQLNIHKPVYNAWQPGNFIDDALGLMIYADFAGQLRFLDLETNTVIASLTLPERTQYDHIGWVNEGRIVVIDCESGKLSFIDYYLRQILWSSAVRPCVMAAYDCLHNLVITVEGDGKVRVYTTEVIPSNLSSPVFTTGPIEHRLMGAKVKTRLTGSVGEPCKDWWIHWEILGPFGSLEKTKSKTDIDGYAENYYFGPVEIGETGSEQIQVSVQVP